MVKIPRSYRGRLKKLGKANGFRGVDDFGGHLIDRGLRRHPGAADPAVDLHERLQIVVDVMGYSSRDELVEHLIERGLSAYETAEVDPKKFEERLRGLGYIE
jgi:hypothetical protein